MTKVNCLNPISKLGLNKLNDNYEIVDDFNEADVALVRSAAMHDLDLPASLLAVARAGAGVNNIPLISALKMVLLYLTHLVQMQMVLKN